VTLHERDECRLFAAVDESLNQDCIAFLLGHRRTEPPREITAFFLLCPVTTRLNA
jgi:hypothetical protein